jgi:hypothetical protein
MRGTGGQGKIARQEYQVDDAVALAWSVTASKRAAKVPTRKTDFGTVPIRYKNDIA